MGNWTHLPPDPHKHDNPSTVNARQGKILVGARWRCACGLEFEVTRTQFQADQKDGDFYYVFWKEYRRHSPFPAQTPDYRDHAEWEIR